MHVEPLLRTPAMILAFAGWNDAGDASTAAVRYLDEGIRSVPLAEIECEDFFDFTVRRPDVVQRRNREGSGLERLIVWPDTEFRYGAVQDGREIITGIGIEPHLRWRSYCDAVIELARRQEVGRIYLLGAYQADVVYSQPVQVTGFATDVDSFDLLGVASSDYQGPTGIVGVLASRLEEAGFPVVSLWAGLPHYINVSPNPRGALALVQRLAQLLAFPLDEEPLRKRAAEFEERINKLVTSDTELTEYVRQLKRKEFAS